MDVTIISSIIGIGVLGLLFGASLAYASRKFAVEVDPKVELVLKALSGANCGACGYPGCSAYAEAVVQGKAEINSCTPGGQATANQIAQILGKEVVGAMTPVIAVVQCQGGNKEARRRFIYQGLLDCTAAQLIASGDKACVYGCLGLGSCVKACPFDAMFMNSNGLPEVIEDKCTGCGICVKTCPRGIIKLIPKTQKIYLGCVSQDRGKKVKDACIVGCTGCTLCANPKTTPSGAIKMEGNLPVIVNAEADDLMNAVTKCPAKSFVVRIT
ncbi:MAG: RnfABCDGE type electron transport complex subunit B [candidate division KSB1 bacterium]|nr:RnfABCDGE type electron transport complex subunit B [candidate division KSB1 bacterium]